MTISGDMLNQVGTTDLCSRQKICRKPARLPIPDITGDSQESVCVIDLEAQSLSPRNAERVQHDIAIATSSYTKLKGRGYRLTIDDG